MSANPSPFQLASSVSFSTANMGTTHFDGDDPNWAIAAAEPRHRTHTPQPAAVEPARMTAPSDSFWPAPPQSLEETGLRPSQLESLILKFLLNSGIASGRETAAQIALPFTLVQKLLLQMKEAQLLGIKSEAPLGDYQFTLTDFGSDLARRHVQQCTYFGAAPVSLEHYAASVTAQSPQHHPLNPHDVQHAFENLVLSNDVVLALGEAVNMGRGLFLYGAAGNGKSTIAENMRHAYSRNIWIPRALTIGGQIVRLFDAIQHRVVEDDPLLSNQPYDRRWLRIQRPSVTVGGELELSAFDITTNPITGISEAPIQVKSNCGTLLIDDFGRNRFRPADLLNRLVVPLERRADTLHLKSGRTFSVPFGCMVVFSANLSPSELVDEAFLRRIPYKIALSDPSDEQFQELMRREAALARLEIHDETIHYVLNQHFTAVGRARRFCHPRDLLQIVSNACDFLGQPRVVTRENLDAAVGRYFSK
jgi:hypothetical protein